MHLAASSDAPEQFIPPYNGNGLLQLRCRYVTPEPQTGHGGLQDVHALHPPSTSGMWKNYSCSFTQYSAIYGITSIMKSAVMTTIHFLCSFCSSPSSTSSLSPHFIIPPPPHDPASVSLPPPYPVHHLLPFSSLLCLFFLLS